ncbi:MAG: MauE/DoxX family redox-associated membrane protein [Candidatus Auribacterota bacterium]|jgi:uncharacterized membrane protein YphA (DoxX/SURF4 family)|nr:MauE/DoxX family redox-associated membrane protein [Candidatus Auribacterota bacterium]
MTRKPDLPTFLYWIMRVFLGGLFIFSGMHKLFDPLGFAKIIFNYQLTPHILINFAAVVMPFVELLCGLMLIFGVFRISALVTLEALLVFFTILIGINILRGLDFTCGCFSNSTEKTFLNQPIVSFIKNFVLLAIGGYLIKREKPLIKTRYSSH